MPTVNSTEQHKLTVWWAVINARSQPHRIQSGPARLHVSFGLLRSGPTRLSTQQKQKLSHFYYFSRTLLEKKWQLHTASQMKNNSDSFIPANPWDHDPTTRARIMVWRVSYITILSFPPLRVVVHESLARAAPWMTIDQRGVLAAHGLLPPVDIG